MCVVDTIHHAMACCKYGSLLMLGGNRGFGFFLILPTTCFLNVPNMIKAGHSDGYSQELADTLYDDEGLSSLIETT